MFPLLISLCTGTAVLLVADRLRPVWQAFVTRYLRGQSPALRSLKLGEDRWRGLLHWWGILMLLAFLALSFPLGMPAVAVGVVLLIYGSPRWYLRRLIRRRAALMREQIVSACGSVVAGVRAGMSLEQGLALASRETPEPLASELRRVVQEMEHGATPEAALTSAKERLNLLGFTLFTAAVLVCKRRGGKLTEALERIADSLKENQRLDRKLEADTASGHRVVFLLTIFPFAFLALFYLLDPQTMGLLFSTIPGQIVLVLAGLFVYLGRLWAVKILKLDQLPGA